ncbi:hypothetical protein Tco_1200284 [Tanacetum coccineum]
MKQFTKTACLMQPLQMATKPLTPAAIAMTEKKMDMSLDDIIKMSKNGTVANKAKQQRIPNKNQKFTNNVAQDKSMKLRRFMDSRSSVRQGALAQRRSNFQGNQFPLTTQAARKAAVAPIRNRNFHQNQATTSYKPSVDLRLESFAAIILGVSARSLGCSSNESTEAANTKAVHGWKFTLVAIFPISGLFSVSSFVKLRNGKYNAGSFLGVAVSRQFQNRPQSNGSFAAKQQTQPKVVSKQRPQQTLDSLFANMKEERMKIMSHQQNNNNSGRRNGPGQQRPRPPWTRRYNN